MGSIIIGARGRRMCRGLVARFELLVQSKDQCLSAGLCWVVESELVWYEMRQGRVG